jgi:hypothetical protein
MTSGVYVPLHWPRPGQPALRPEIGQHLAVAPDVWGAIRRLAGIRRLRPDDSVTAYRGDVS